MRFRPHKAHETASVPLVVPLEHLAGADRDQAGSKAVNLGVMIRAGLPAPRGFCVTSAAFELWFDACVAAQRCLDGLDRLNATQTKETQQTASGLRQMLATAPLPDSVEHALSAAWAQRGPALAWAVRSSATQEDLPNSSFAGQHDTLLNVHGREAFLNAVRGCWVSLFTDRAVFYRMKNRISQRSAAMAVVVQEMVPADAAGILFTVNPVTGNAGHMVIEGAAGLGDQLVSGRVNPECVLLEKATLHVIERRQAAEAPCLHDALVRRLGELGLEAERIFAGPQDLEWAASRGQVFLLQSRPISALPGSEEAEREKRFSKSSHSRGNVAHFAQRGEPPAKEPRRREGRGEKIPHQPRAIWAASGPEPEPHVRSHDSERRLEVWTNANVIEAFPQAVTPMAWSLMQILLHDFLYPLMRRLGLEAGPPPLIDLIAGRAYLNIGGILGLLRKISPIQVDVSAAFGGHYAHFQEALQWDMSSRSGSCSLANLGRAIRLGVWLLPGLFRQQQLLERWGARVFGKLADTSPESLTDEQLARHPAALLRVASVGEGERTWAAAAWMGIGAVGGSMAVFHLARRWLDDPDGSLANRLLSGAGNMNSAENGLALYRLAAWAKEHPAVAQALMAPGSFAELERRLSTAASGPEFLDRWQTFMANHGHQARGGMDLGQPRWSEMPEHVLDLLRACLEVAEEANPLKLQARRLKERAAVVADCRRRLRNPIRRAVFLFLLRTGQRGLMQRENVKNEGVRLIAVLRRAMVEAGRRLEARGVLAQRQDVFFLKLEELEPVLCGRAAFDVQAAVAERKAEHARHQELRPPPEIVRRYDATVPLPPPIDAGTNVLRGVAVSPGVVTGLARVILQADADERVRPGEILVAPYTDPGWTPYFLPAAGLVVDIGGLLSHGSVVAREYGLPAVVNVGPATRVLRTGDLVQVDGNRGRVTVLERASNR